MAAPQQEIAGHRLEQRLGQGTGGEVWRARFGGQPVALKLFERGSLPPRIEAESVAQYALSRGDDPRARYFARAEHFDLEHDPPYLRMELVEGPTLREAGALPEARVRRIAEALFEALDHAHQQGFAHGDLKPQNVLLPSGEGQPAIKLIDAGFGALVPPPAAPELDHSLGSLDRGVATPRYAPPERFTPAYRDDPAVARAADLFMAGKLLYEALSGSSPETIRPLARAGHPPGWDELIFALVEERPADRPSAAEALRRVRALEPAPRRELPALMPLAYLGLPLLVPLLVLALLALLRTGPRQAAALPAARDSTVALAARARALLDAGRLELAVPYYRALLEREPDHLEAHDALARYHVERREPVAALRHATRAAELAPRQPHLHNRVGQLALQLGRPAEALRSFESAIRLDPRQAGLHANLGVALHQLGRHAGARRAFGQALQIDAHNVEALRNLAAMAVDGGDAAELRGLLRRLHETDPAEAEQFLVALGRQDPARAASLRAWLGR